LLNLIVYGIRAQSDFRITRPEYFEIYHNMAIIEMHRSGVPASITLAQGALESADGNSSLAREANNHFGIKCHEDWSGKRTFQDDDARNECFRRYGSVEDSFKDHSDYLRAKTRYSFLFDLDKGDYKGWAKGLKKAGYATNPAYAESLIRIIEEFGLHKYDGIEIEDIAEHKKPGHPGKIGSLRETGEINRVKFIRAGTGDTYESLAAELGKLNWELPQFNDASLIDPIDPGQIVYIQPKRNRARAGQNFYKVKSGETMQIVSRQFAVKLDRLYDMNRMKPGSQPEPGTVLNLRNTIKSSRVPDQGSPEKISGGDEEDVIRVDLNLE